MKENVNLELLQLGRFRFKFFSSNFKCFSRTAKLHYCRIRSLQGIFGGFSPPKNTHFVLDNKHISIF